MRTSRIDALDLRPAKVISAEKRQAVLDGQGLWFDWDTIFPDTRRRITVNIVANMAKFNAALAGIGIAMRTATSRMGEFTPPSRRYRPMRSWNWTRILIVLGTLCAFATCVYVEVVAWL
jgi:hypothetical protein